MDVLTSPSLLFGSPKRFPGPTSITLLGGVFQTIFLWNIFLSQDPINDQRLDFLKAVFHVVQLADYIASFIAHISRFRKDVNWNKSDYATSDRVLQLSNCFSWNEFIYLFDDSAKTSTGASLRTKRPTIAFLILKLFLMNWTFPDNTTTMKHLGSIAILCWVVSMYLQCFVEGKSQMIFYKLYTDNCALYFVSFNYVLPSCFLSPFSVSWADIRYHVQMTSSRRRPNLYGGRSTYSLSSTIAKLRINIFIAVVAAILTTAMKMQHV